jgi:hypothetical protein
MLQMVRNGDLNYKSALNNSMLISSGVPIQSADPLRHGKDSIIVFTSIVCRAAIEGGLSSEEAYYSWRLLIYKQSNGLQTIPI